MKYPITPDYLEYIPNYIVQLYIDLEEFVISDICRRLKLSGEMTNSAIDQINVLRRRGFDLSHIEKRIRETLHLSQQEYNEIFDRAIERNQEYYDYTIKKADLTYSDFSLESKKAEFEAIRAQTLGEFVNIAQSLGFALRGADGKVEFLSIAKTYQKILDDAEMQVWSGAVDYNTAIKMATKRLVDSGLQTVDYSTGWHNRADTAARRAVMTGVSQLSAKYSDQLMKELDTPYMEVTAHSGARDIEGKSPWASHKKWQGRVYSIHSGDIYPSVYAVCGWGEVDGLEGANCRHHHFPWVEGVSERTYTDEQLANIDPPPFTYQGREYTRYQATQKMRQIERAVRKSKELSMAFKEEGLDEDSTAMKARARALNQAYRDFAKAADLRTQPERMRVDYVSDKAREKAAELAEKRGAIGGKYGKRVESPFIRDTIKETINGGGASVRTIGKIDIEKYRVVSENIRTDEVVITDERIGHIQERHPNDFERYSQYIEDILLNPQYILADKSPDTAVILKKFCDSGEQFRLILKLAISKDEAFKKNSIITFLKISEKKFKKYLRNKKILYKSE